MNLTPEEETLIVRHRLEKEHEEYKYLHLMQDILDNGKESKDRTGVGTKKLFGTQLKFNLRESFPVLTTKKVFWKGVVEELLWFIRGSTNSNDLENKGVNIWKGNTSREFLDQRGLRYTEGEAGPIYGFQWRNFNGTFEFVNRNIPIYQKPADLNEGSEDDPIIPERKMVEYLRVRNDGVDQLNEALMLLKNRPDDRRIIVSAWNPTQLPKMSLAPCHLLFQFQVSNGELNCQWYQRSCDFFLGVPFNISSYALLTCLFAKASGLTPGELTFCGGDTHLYLNHTEQAKLQISRTPYPFPKLEIPDVTSIEDMEKLSLDDCKLVNYKSHKIIKADMAV
jgi:thymidylate synthase